MLYPHRVRLSDLRNRQPVNPADGYNAYNYDYFNIFNRSADFFKGGKSLANLNKNYAEPPVVEPHSEIVQCLVTMVDDGDRNLDEVSYSFRIPIEEIRRISRKFNDQRALSLESYNYSSGGGRDPRDVARTTFRIGNSQTYQATYTLQDFISSSFLSKEIPFTELDITGTGNNDSPLDDSKFGSLDFGGLQRFNLEDGTIYDDVVFIGSWPPIRKFINSNDAKEGDDRLVREVFSYRLNDPEEIKGSATYAVLADPYPFRFVITRVDTFYDMVDLRARIQLLLV